MSAVISHEVGADEDQNTIFPAVAEKKRHSADAHAARNVTLLFIYRRVYVNEVCDGSWSVVGQVLLVMTLHALSSIAAVNKSISSKACMQPKIHCLPGVVH
jgi:hypothetical protein